MVKNFRVGEEVVGSCGSCCVGVKHPVFVLVIAFHVEIDYIDKASNKSSRIINRKRV